MRIETIRMVSDWLKNPLYGVNVYIPLVPRDADDDQPPLIAPWNVDDTGVFNETEHEHVADRLDPPVRPALYVTSEGDVEMEGEPTPDGQIRATDGSFVVVVRYVTEDADSMRARRDGEYTLRAVLRSVRELLKNAYADTARKRNDILLVDALGGPTTFVPVIEKIGSCRVTGAVGFMVNVRDANPSF